MFSHDIWVWIAAVLTLAIFSFLYKENPFYRFAEYLFVGMSAGYGLARVWNNALVPNFINPFWAALTAERGATGPLLADPRFWLIVPALLGLLYICRFIPSLSHLILVPIAIGLGLGSGMGLAAIIQTDIIKQMQSAIGDASNVAAGGWPLVWGIVSLVGVLTTLSYFFFSREHKGALKYSANIGIWFLMVGFGASFGNTVMGRVSLLIGRVQFLLTDWIHVIR
ncbi:MAG: hypothetical protein MUF78_06530 [Candidatus Edwardsbacteria bacterium]|jgi:hypothetical protein|nr:hypothetical protein [Candidatus Edwardsbacteria bacterium]